MMKNKSAKRMQSFFIIPFFFLLGIGTAFILPGYLSFSNNSEAASTLSYHNAQTIPGIGGGPPAQTSSIPACFP